jgi:hypothetical protein
VTSGLRERTDETPAAVRHVPRHARHRHADVRGHQLDRLVSMVGAMVICVVLPVLAYQVTGSSLWTGAVTGAEALPYLLSGLVAGAAADRVDRRRLMVAADMANAALLASVPIAYAFDTLTTTHLLLAAFGAQVLFICFEAATRVAGNAVPKSGPGGGPRGILALAGVLVAGTALAPLLTVDAVSFVVSALLIRAISAPLRDHSGPVARPARRRAGTHSAEANRYRLVGCLRAAAVGAFLGQLVPWMDQTLGVRPGGDVRLGLFFAAWGAGGLLAGVVLVEAARRIDEQRVALVFLLGSALCGLACVLCTNWVLAALAVIGWGLADTVVASSVSTASRLLLFGVALPVGALAGGAVAEAFHVQAAITASVLLLVVAAVVGVPISDR